MKETPFQINETIYKINETIVQNLQNFFLNK